jgi:predicted ATPase
LLPSGGTQQQQKAIDQALTIASSNTAIAFQRRSPQNRNDAARYQPFIAATERALPLSELSPQKRKEATLAGLMAQLEGLSAHQPVLVVFEDAHWIDPTSLELLAITVERLPQLRVLLLITARPEFAQPWPGHAHVTTLPLTHLNRQIGSAIIERVAAGKTLPEEVTNQILARTDGVRLFLEELTKTVLEGGLLQERDGHYVLDRPLPALAIPTTSRVHRTGRRRDGLLTTAAIGSTDSLRTFVKSLLLR